VAAAQPVGADNSFISAVAPAFPGSPAIYIRRRAQDSEPSIPLSSDIQLSPGIAQRLFPSLLKAMLWGKIRLPPKGVLFDRKPISISYNKKMRKAIPNS
jgi:hypothetical protein